MKYPCENGKLRVQYAELFLLLVTSLALMSFKQIYIPKDLQDNDFNNPDSRWCYAHSRQTDNSVILINKQMI